MYQSLSDEDKIVYDMFLDMVQNMDKSGYSSAIIVLDTKLKELGNKYFWHIYYAMCYDHPEYFYLLAGEPKLTCTYSSYLGSTTFYYEVNNLSNIEEKQKEAFDNATREFLRSIDLTLPDSEKELQIHDKLIQLVSYDKELYERHLANDAVRDLGYTAYGALVQDSSGNSNMAVCQGYALAYEYLLHKAGIPCGFVSGRAEADSDEPYYQEQRGHAWNVVRIDGSGTRLIQPGMILMHYIWQNILTRFIRHI